MSEFRIVVEQLAQVDFTYPIVIQPNAFLQIDLANNFYTVCMYITWIISAVSYTLSSFTQQYCKFLNNLSLMCFVKCYIHKYNWILQNRAKHFHMKSAMILTIIDQSVWYIQNAFVSSQIDYLVFHFLMLFLFWVRHQLWIHLNDNWITYKMWVHLSNKSLRNHNDKLLYNFRTRHSCLWIIWIWMWMLARQVHKT